MFPPRALAQEVALGSDRLGFLEFFLIDFLIDLKEFQRLERLLANRKVLFQPKIIDCNAQESVYPQLIKNSPKLLKYDQHAFVL